MGAESTPHYRELFVSWLTDHGAGQESIPHLLDAFCRFLISQGFAIYRCNLATDTIHPQMTALRHVWFSEETDPGPINPAVLVDRRQYRIGDALIDEVFFNSGSRDSPQYKVSPFFKIKQLGELYQVIPPAGGTQPYPVFADLAERGCSAYFGMLLKSFAGMQQMIGLATRRPGGLTSEQIDDLRWSLSLLTLHINTLIEFSIKNTLARVYLGRDPGQRVSDGMIAVGNVISLEGAIWFSDLRGFTETSERLSPEALIETLNDYFVTVVGPIYAHKGEVLKYIGDAILAVFPVSNFSGTSAACRAALDAMNEAQRNLAAVNAERTGSGSAPMKHGVGLHYGQARYGNIGSIERLDFTLIGREVNIASRIESLSKELGEPVLCSQSFVDKAAVRMREIGRFSLKGVAEPVQVCAPESHGATPESMRD